MKGVSGIIGGVVVIILLLLAVSLILAAMNYIYGVQQIEAKTIMSQLSQPHIAQVSPDSVMTSGRLIASYIIYPNGRIVVLNETVSGIKGFQTYLNGSPWAVIVFSNGQWVNVTSQSVTPPGVGYLSGSGSVPYYPNAIEPWNLTQLSKFMSEGFRYNTPIYSKIVISETYMGKTYNTTLNPTDPVVYGMGRVLSVPVKSTQGWLNFTLVYTKPIMPWDSQALGFAVIVQNSSNIQEVVYFRIIINSSYESLQNGYIQYYVNYGNYQFWEDPVYEPSYYHGGVMNTFYNYNESTTFSESVSQLLGPNTPWWSVWSFNSYPVFKVAIKFSLGEPAKVYLWRLSYNGSGFTWEKLYLPSINGTVTQVKYTWAFWFNGLVGYWYKVYYVDWRSVTQRSAWPVNVYTESVDGNNVYLLPLVPQVGSNILVVPQTGYIPPTYQSWWNYPSPPYIPDTLILNVTYSI